MIIDNQRMDHSHEPEQERILQGQKLRQKCKKRALEETTERPKKVIMKSRNIQSGIHEFPLDFGNFG
jgi:hypothetical protein